MDSLPPDLRILLGVSLLGDVHSVFGTDVSDASSTTGFDMKKRDWAWEILGRLGLPEDIFPECHESMEIFSAILFIWAKLSRPSTWFFSHFRDIPLHRWAPKMV